MKKTATFYDSPTGSTKVGTKQICKNPNTDVFNTNNSPNNKLSQYNKLIFKTPEISKKHFFIQKRKEQKISLSYIKSKIKDLRSAFLLLHPKYKVQFYDNTSLFSNYKTITYNINAKL